MQQIALAEEQNTSIYVVRAEQMRLPERVPVQVDTSRRPMSLGLRTYAPIYRVRLFCIPQEAATDTR